MIERGKTILLDYEVVNETPKYNFYLGFFPDSLTTNYCIFQHATWCPGPTSLRAGASMAHFSVA